mmetsp:Transcript_27241/g.65614  ORF Transcript_27241/g.65614 Transcript_27241/m.65614 type:complete len:244 (+) Transcript_27241:70-801(+)
MMEDYDKTLKVIVIGNGQVGKTSMITRYAKGIFTNEYKKTLAVDFLEKREVLREIGEEMCFHLWDTAGQEEYAEVTRAYYKGAGACIVAFSTVDRASFDAVENWVKKATDECGPELVMVLVQNKVDLIDQAVVTKEEVEAIAQKLKLKLYRMSVRDGLNVVEVFQNLGIEFHKRGGEAKLGVQSVTPIEKHATRPAAAGGSRPSGGSAGPANGGGETITLHNDKPSKQRTGGKKSRFSQCSIL